MEVHIPIRNEVTDIELENVSEQVDIDTCEIIYPDDSRICKKHNMGIDTAYCITRSLREIFYEVNGEMYGFKIYTI